MEVIFSLLKPFLPFDVYQKDSGYEVYELFTTLTDEQIGLYTLNEDGELSSFSLEIEAEGGNASQEELLTIAERFIQIFHPDKKDDYELSSIMDLDNPYMISFEKREETYGLFLHSEGFTVLVSTNGQVQQFFYEKEEYQIHYPKNVISEAEANKKYMENLQFDLVITEFDKEIYKNGDNQIHLAYTINEQALDIPADGREPAVIMKELDLEPITQQQVPSEDIYRLIGLTPMHNILRVIEEKNQRIEIWSLNNAEKYITGDIDEVQPDLIKLCFDQESGQLLQLSSGENPDRNEKEQGNAATKQKALNIMFKLYPEAHFLFQLEELKEEMDEEEYDLPQDEASLTEESDLAEEDEDVYFVGDTEENDTFYFHLMHEGVLVDDCVSIIGIGKYSGKVNNFRLNVLEKDVYQRLISKPALSLEEARKIYNDLLKMELLFVREYDEMQKAVYTLSYGPSFPKMVGHVRAIDAITGSALYVDVGGTTFY